MSDLPPMNDSESPPKDEKKKSGMGCLAGCALVFGVLMLLGMLITGGLAFYFFTSGPTPETTPFVGDDAWLVGHLTLDAEDPGTQALLGAALAGMQARNARQQAQAELPDWVRSLNQLNQVQGNAVLEQFAPEDVLGVLYPGEADEVRGLLTIRLGYLPRFYQTMFSTIASQGVTEDFEEHGDHTIIPGGEGGAFTLVGKNIVMTDRLEDMRDALDRLDMQAAPGPLWERLMPLQEKGQGQLVANLSALPTPWFHPSCTELAAWLQLGDGETVTVHLEVSCGEDAPARARLKTVLEHTRDQMAEDGLEATVYVPEAGVQGDLEVKPVASWLQDVFSGERPEPAWPDAMMQGQSDPAPPTTGKGDEAVVP